MTDTIVLKTAEYEYQILPDGTIELLRYIGPPSEHIQIPPEIDGRPVTVIGESLFHIKASDAVKKSVKSVSIPATVTTIKSCAFCLCPNLSEINFSKCKDNLRNVGCFAFTDTAYYYDEKNWVDGILYINHGRCIVDTEKDFFDKYFKTKGAKVLNISSDVTCIASDAFSGRKGFMFAYGQNITINSCAFYNTDLKCPIFADCEIHATAFAETPFMKKPENWRGPCLYVGKELLSCKAKTGTWYDVEQGTVAVSDGAFDGCGKNVTITLPLSVERIGASLFPDGFLFYCEH